MRRTLVSAALALAAIGIVGCTATGEPESGAQTTSTRVPTPDPVMTATAPPSLDQIDLSYWSAQVFGTETPLWRKDEVLAPGHDEEADVTGGDDVRVDIACTGFGAATVTVVVTSAGSAAAPETLTCSPNLDPEAAVLSIDVVGGKSTTLAMSASAEAGVAMQSVAR
jgi:hypothetical protein